MTNTQNTAENIFNMLDATRERVVTPPMGYPARFSDKPRCAVCHRDAHTSGYQGHDYQAPQADARP